jgi:putative transposase
VRQTSLIRRHGLLAAKSMGAETLHDDLLDQGEICPENRVARLTSLAGIPAQIGYGRRPGQYGGKPAVVAG